MVVLFAYRIVQYNSMRILKPIQQYFRTSKKAACSIESNSGYIQISPSILRRMVNNTDSQELDFNKQSINLSPVYTKVF